MFQGMFSGLDFKKLLSSVNVWSKFQGNAVISVFSTANSVIIDGSLSNIFDHSLSENTTFGNPTTTRDGLYKLIIRQAATPFTVDFGEKFLFDGDAPEIGTAEGDILILNLVCYAGKLYCISSSNFSV